MQWTDAVDIMTSFIKADQGVMTRGKWAYSRIKVTIEVLDLRTFLEYKF